MATICPIDIPTWETADFIAANVAEGASILEIGCGEGHVAAELVERGFTIIGVDEDTEAVERAVAKGVDARVGEWPEMNVPNVDAVAFTRSLHHIEPLERAIDKAAEVLPARGLLLLEDFAFNVTDRKTMEWFLDLIRRKPIASIIENTPDEFITRMLSADDPIKEWEQDKHHDLHSADAMKAAIGRQFEIVVGSEAPYFYRYLVPVFPETPQAAKLAEAVLAEEKRLGSTGEIVQVGQRVVAIKRRNA